MKPTFDRFMAASGCSPREASPVWERLCALSPAELGELLAKIRDVGPLTVDERHHFTRVGVPQPEEM